MSICRAESVRHRTRRRLSHVRHQRTTHRWTPEASRRFIHLLECWCHVPSKCRATPTVLGRFQVVSLLYTGTAVRGTQGWGVGECRGGEGGERRAQSSGLTYEWRYGSHSGAQSDRQAVATPKPPGRVSDYERTVSFRGPLSFVCSRVLSRASVRASGRFFRFLLFVCLFLFSPERSKFSKTAMCCVLPERFGRGSEGEFAIDRQQQFGCVMQASTTVRACHTLHVRYSSHCAHVLARGGTCCHASAPARFRWVGPVARLGIQCIASYASMRRGHA